MNAKKKTDEQEVAVVVLDRAHKIEKFMGRPFHELMAMKQSFGLPIKKIGGFPTLSLKDYQAWAEEYSLKNIEPHKITIEMLSDAKRKNDVQNMESVLLESLQAISEFVQYPAHVCKDWADRWTDCPIKKENRIYTVETRDLVSWMMKMNIKMGHGRDIFAI